jgi:rubrerythrin
MGKIRFERQDVEAGWSMEIEKAGRATVEALEDSDYVELTAAGAPVVGEFRCAECGYGAIVHGRLPSCPMCGGTSWEQSSWSPFSRGTPLEPPR